MRAMILAAGMGSRLQAITKDVPKPMLKMNHDRRIVDTVIDSLTRIGIREIAVNLHHQRQQLRDYLVDRHADIDWHFSEEEELLNTGGGIYQCRDFLAASEEFIVTNADILYLFDLGRCIQQHRERGSLCTLLLIPSTPERAVFFREGEGVLGFTNPQGRLYFDMSYPPTADDRYGTFTGVSIYNRRVFDFFMGEGAYSIVDVFVELIRKGERVDFVLLEKDYWNDIGTFEGLERGRRDFEILDLASKALDGEVTAFHHLFKGASSKSVFRIVINDVPRIVTYSESQRELRSWEGFAAYFCRLPVPVPQVILSRQNWLLMEDGGPNSLYDIAQEQRTRGEFPLAHYEKLVDILVELSRIDVATFPVELCNGKQRFDFDNIRFDLRYFSVHFHEDRLQPGEVEELASAVHELLAGEPECIMHRDFQSTNVLINYNFEPRIVDLQTLRIGYSIYDLASLLFDPYVEIDEATRERLLDRYYQQIDAESSARDRVWVAALIRLLQCLATFGAMGDRGAGFYADKIPRALANLSLVMRQIDRCQADGSLVSLQIPASILDLQANP